MAAGNRPWYIFSRYPSIPLLQGFPLLALAALLLFTSLRGGITWAIGLSVLMALVGLFNIASGLLHLRLIRRGTPPRFD